MLFAVDLSDDGRLVLEDRAKSWKLLGKTLTTIAVARCYLGKKNAKSLFFYLLRITSLSY
jgi:hypothetical protein